MGIKRLLLLGLFVLLPSLAWGQGNTVILTDDGAPSFGCPFIMLYTRGDAQELYACDPATDTFFLVGPGAAGATSWSSLTDPTGATSFTDSATTETVTFTFVTAFAVATQRFLIEQNTGNPTGGVLFEVRADDANVAIVRFGETNGVEVSQAGALTAIGTGTIVATSGDSATGFFPAGEIEAARGGTGADSSAATGVPEVAAGTWTFAANIADLAASTSTEFFGVISNETGGALVVGSDSPVFTTQFDLEAAGIRFTSDGDGALTLLGLGDGFDEDLTFNLDDTENTVVLSSSTGVTTFDFGGFALQNTLYDVDGTGNVLTTTHYIQFNMGVSQAGTASGACSTPASNAPAVTSVVGTNTIYATYAFDADTDESIQCHFSFPPDWDGVIDEATFRWRAASTTMEVVWGLQTVCVAIGETGDPAFNAAQTVTDTVQGTTLQWNDATISMITVTGCAADEEIFIKPFRDANNAADDMTGDGELLWVRLKFGRNQ